MRSGLQAQGAIFNRELGSYAWGVGPDWLADDAGAPESLATLATSGVGVGQLRNVLGTGGAASGGTPFHRIVTVLGSEGTGNSDVAGVLTKEINAVRIDLPRDESWGRRETEFRDGISPRQVHCRDGAARARLNRLRLPLTTASRPTDALPAYLRGSKRMLTGHEVLLFNGVDRLERDDWSVLVSILNLLPYTYRMIFVTKQWDRATGFVVRTEDLMGSVGSLADMRKPPLESYGPRAVELQTAIDDGGDDWQDARGHPPDVSEEPHHPPAARFVPCLRGTSGRARQGGGATPGRRRCSMMPMRNGWWSSTSKTRSPAWTCRLR